MIPSSTSGARASASVLFLGKREDAHCLAALRFCELAFSAVTSHLGAWGDPLPRPAREWSGDYIVSYLSRWVVPEDVLQRAEVAAINFHPAPPEYPGIGCTNFALYENAKSYGVTCHHMARQVDTGEIIAVTRFPVFDDDDVASLLRRTYDHQLVLFYEIVGKMSRGTALPTSTERWSRPPFTRKQFNDLGRITADMSPEEVTRRIRATNFGPWKPILELHGLRFELKEGS